MTKKRGIFDVNVGVRKLLPENDQSVPQIDSKQLAVQSQSYKIKDALTAISRQMKISRNRSGTISENALHVEHFQTVTNVGNVSYSRQHLSMVG